MRDVFCMATDLKSLRRVLPTSVPVIASQDDWNKAQQLREDIRDYIEKVDENYQPQRDECANQAKRLRNDRTNLEHDRATHLTVVDDKNNSHNIESIDKLIAKEMSRFATELREGQQRIESTLQETLKSAQTKAINQAAVQLAKKGQTDQAVELLTSQAVATPTYVKPLPGTMTKLDYVELDRSLAKHRFLILDRAAVMVEVNKRGKGAELIVGEGAIKVMDKVIARRKSRRNK